MIAFKEWETVCQALATGEQTVILRKGGIHEGREGFSFAHDEFLLFPTRFHGQADSVRLPVSELKPAWTDGEEVSLEYVVKVSKAVTLTDWEEVKALSEKHIWTEQTIRERFDWSGKGMETGSIHVAYVTVSRLADPIIFPYEKKYGGCRSWVEVPEPAENWRNTIEAP